VRAAAITSILVLCAACAHEPVPPGESAFVQLSDSPMPPFFLLDFSSVELRAGSLKFIMGKWRWARIGVAKQSILVAATKGPHGSFGQVVTSQCSSWLEFDARADQEYRIEYVRRPETDAIQVMDIATGFVVGFDDCK
jgi:hypothetical protein